MADLFPSHVDFIVAREAILFIVAQEAIIAQPSQSKINKFYRSHSQNYKVTQFIHLQRILLTPIERLQKNSNSTNVMNQANMFWGNN